MEIRTEDIDSSPVSPNPRTRTASDRDLAENKPLNLQATQFMMPTPPDTDQSSNASPSHAYQGQTREVSPSASSSALSSVDVVSNSGMAFPSTIASRALSIGPEQPPAKRRKVTPAEREQKQKEKEAKDAEKLEQKTKRDEGKRIKNEEKRKKAEEREVKKREKELEEERKIQEKVKKERSQMRLGAFFQKPATLAKSPAVEADNPFDGARRKSLSLEPPETNEEETRKAVSPSKGAQSVAEKKTPVKSAISDYQKYFLPFVLPSHSSIAPLREFGEDDAAEETFDCELKEASLAEKNDLDSVSSCAGLPRQFADESEAPRGFTLLSVRELVKQIQGSVQNPVDLTVEGPLDNPMEALQSVPRRHIQFSEDVRPAYFGSYTKIRSPRATKKLRRNPFTRARRDTDYDYDSEAEWEEPDEEGEDLVDEDDDEAESLGDAGEMNDFLDDEEDSLKNKRKMIAGDLAPTSTGLCWEDVSGKIMQSVEGDKPSTTMHGMRMGVLLPGVSGTPIDPFSTVYWEPEPTSAPWPLAAASTLANGSMAPPRPPLQPRPNSNGTFDLKLVGAAEGMKGPINSVSATPKAKPAPKPAPRTLRTEDLEEFKDAVIGSQLGKADLLKGLKSRFPKLKNDMIKNTLGDHFAQIGASKAEKKWVFVPPMS